MGLFGFRAPCAGGDAVRRDEALSPLCDREDPLVPRDAGERALATHLAGCATCTGALRALRETSSLLAGLGDASGAAPSDAELRHVLATVAAERRVRAPRMRLVWATTAIATVALAGAAVRQVVMARAYADTDAAILAGADAAYRRAEREYAEAVALLRTQLTREGGGQLDPAVAEGARVLEEARRKAGALAAARRGDAEREALLREAARAEVRYYEDALLRQGAAPEPQP